MVNEQAASLLIRRLYLLGSLPVRAGLSGFGRAAGDADVRPPEVAAGYPPQVHRAIARFRVQLMPASSTSSLGLLGAGASVLPTPGGTARAAINKLCPLAPGLAHRRTGEYRLADVGGYRLVDVARSSNL
jgi:hypothetical protein